MNNGVIIILTIVNVMKGYTAGQKDAQMLRDICGWLNINSMRAEKVSRQSMGHMGTY